MALVPAYNQMAVEFLMEYKYGYKKRDTMYICSADREKKRARVGH